MHFKRNEFLVFGQPDISQLEIDEVIDTLKSGWLGTGPKVKAFEKDFASYKKVKDAVALSSCSSALQLALLSADVGHGDEVITTVFTFVATVNAIIHVGAKPILVDIDPITMNICVDQIERAITNRTKAIIPVHYAGRPCDMDAITQIAQKYNLLIIEDAAHAVEAEYKKQKIGTIGDYGCFSFYSTKNLCTAEGGMIISKNNDNLSKIRKLSLHGLSDDAYMRFNSREFKHYYATELGHKFNMTDIQASLGIHQLSRLEDNWKKRQSIWNFYQNELSHLPLTLPASIPSDIKHAYHLYTISINTSKSGISRDNFIAGMKKRNIGCGIHYLSIAEHPYHQEKLSIRPEDFPNALAASKETVSIPISSKLSETDINDVVSATKDTLKFRDYYDA